MAEPWAPCLARASTALARSSGNLPLLAALSRQWHMAVDAGYGRRDISAARLALSQPGAD
jgi:hypothetical protein